MEGDDGGREAAPRVFLRVPSRLTLPGGDAHSVDTSLATTPARSPPHSPLNDADGVDRGEIIVADGEEEAEEEAEAVDVVEVEEDGYKNDDVVAAPLPTAAAKDDDEEEKEAVDVVEVEEDGGNDVVVAPLPTAAAITDKDSDDEEEEDEEEKARNNKTSVNWPDKPELEALYRRMVRDPVTVAREVYRLAVRHDLPTFYADLLRVSAMCGRVMELVEPFIVEEVGGVFSRERAMTLLRSPSPLGFLLSGALNVLLRPYVRAMLEEPLRLIMARNGSGGDSGEDGALGVEEACALLVDSIEAATKRELMRPNSLLGRLYTSIARVVDGRFAGAEDRDAVYVLVCANSLFLRCIAPTLMQPVEMGLLPPDTHVEAATVQALVAVVRPLQVLAQQKQAESDAMDALAARLKALYGRLRAWTPAHDGEDGRRGDYDEEGEDVVPMMDESKLRAAVEHIDYLLSGRAADDDRVAREAADRERQERRAAREEAVAARTKPKSCFDTCVVRSQRQRPRPKDEEVRPKAQERAARPPNNAGHDAGAAGAVVARAMGSQSVLDVEAEL